ncbi:MAG: carbamate kinase [Bacillota bacterium]
MSRIVIALGGNALGSNPAEQQAAVKHTASSIIDLAENGDEIILAHGNGPQVGMINLAFEVSAASPEGTPEMPFPECGAMSQGYIGYHLQNALREEMKSRGISKNVATVITQVIVDEDDSAFANPSKPIGAFYTEIEAKKLRSEKGYEMVEDAGRGYRRVVPSPKPIDIAEKEIIADLVDNGQMVIACGGGGIPVVEKGHGLQGVPAVIDKDYASEKLAELLAADYLVILTAVEQVAINFGTPEQKNLAKLDLATAEKYCEEGHFAPGSMLPKVKAAMKFAASGKGREALITSLEKAKEGLKGETGTIITAE